jgi:hypothetical protein
MSSVDAAALLRLLLLRGGGRAALWPPHGALERQKTSFTTGCFSAWREGRRGWELAVVQGRSGGERWNGRRKAWAVGRQNVWARNKQEGRARVVNLATNVKTGYVT